MTVEEMKKLACETIDKHAQELIALTDNIFHEPELGFKEFKTAKKFQDKYDAMGLKHKDGVAITGILAPLEGKQHLAKLAIMGELDSVIVPGHPDADPVTHAAHCCGHHCQAVSVLGVAYGLFESGIYKELDGDVVLMHVPSEECVEIEYRKSLIDEGKLSLLGGKQEFIKLGVFDDIDIMIMQHTANQDLFNTGHPDYMNLDAACGGNVGMGFAVRNYRFIGKESHAANPSQGINALEAAKIGLMAIDAQRDTFLEKDHIRIHPIITKGGDLVNVVPADVRIETYIRGNSIDAILAASERIDRSMQAGADALGAKLETIKLPGYAVPQGCDDLKDVLFENLELVYGKGKVDHEGFAGSTDASDVQCLIPAAHFFCGGAVGISHGDDYFIADPDKAVVKAAKAMACTAIDLLTNGAEKALYIKKNYKAPMTKEEYLTKWGGLKKGVVF